MILRGEYRSTRRKTCPITTMSTNLTLTDLGSNPNLRLERPATQPPSHGTALSTEIFVNNTYKFRSQRTKRTPACLEIPVG